MKDLFEIYWTFVKNSKFAHYNDETLLSVQYDESFGGVMMHSLQEAKYHPPEVYADLFLWAFGNSYQTERILDIGLSEWKPHFKTDKYVMCNRLRNGFEDYLFDKDLSSFNSHYPQFVDYFISVLPYIEESFFALTLASKKEKNRFGGKVVAGQRSTRRFFINLLGYGADNMDKSTEARIRTAFSEVDMPDSFYPFVDFIHEHQKNALTLSI